MRKGLPIFSSIIVVFLITGAFLGAFTADGRSALNRWAFSIQKADDATNYNTLKMVEDTCRAYIASYEADKRRYIQYMNSESAEQHSWGEQAKMRANTTASTYNKYILQNSFVWSGNVPDDIRKELEYLD